MRIGVLGAGPAGLYLAILLRKADPSFEIDVLEQNPADATFGWGVVFSEETLGGFRDADFESYTEIVETFARWSAIDVFHRDAAVRSRGHSFSAISRRLLLNILQRRAADFGVRMEFETIVRDLDRFAGYDLVVGADGVNSVVRPLFAEHFRPTLVEYPSRFVWFGTDLVFDAFTFIFRETESGMFQVHGYPIDAETSTFVVECNETTWRRAGLEGQTEEETLAFCADLFADHLEEHRLLSNKSVWRQFIEVRNENWHHGNVVLAGDAVHTAHFTIGSGTKLAMEDSIVLASALLRHRDDLERALTEYELERSPLVERIQEAARESAAYFEHVSRYAHFDPIQFAFNLLTRSGRISYTNMTLRDPVFMRSVDARFADGADADGEAPPTRIVPPPMFAPLRVGAAELGNRVVVRAVGLDGARDGTPSEEERDRIAALGRTGAGLIVTEPVAVSAEGRITAGTPGLYRDDHVAPWRSIVDAVHAAGTRIGAELVHAGRRGATRSRGEGVDLPLVEGTWPLVSASALPYTPQSQVPRKLDRAAMERVRDDFAAAAGRAAEAGFDVLTIHMGHGYLLASFLSPLANRREDEYGGPLENRLRFPLEVLDAVRAAWPEGRILAVRLAAEDWARGGLGGDDAVALATAVGEHGCELVFPVAGQTTARSRPQYRRTFLAPFSDLIRNAAGLPAVAGGNVTTADEVNTLVAAGRADLAVLELPVAT
jgi:anthraniloyl-CoA monooxygenase